MLEKTEHNLCILLSIDYNRKREKKHVFAVDKMQLCARRPEESVKGDKWMNDRMRWNCVRRDTETWMKMIKREREQEWDSDEGIMQSNMRKPMAKMDLNIHRMMLNASKIRTLFNCAFVWISTLIKIIVLSYNGECTDVRCAYDCVGIVASQTCMSLWMEYEKKIAFFKEGEETKRNEGLKKWY